MIVEFAMSQAQSNDQPVVWLIVFGVFALVAIILLLASLGGD